MVHVHVYMWSGYMCGTYASTWRPGLMAGAFLDHIPLSLQWQDLSMNLEEPFG